ncbi:MAG TPA: hypothetical protein VG941_01965, partial [Candidatus Paceibacterota bacterium]|nr:hypothetical protein [Candidatus Paceibacterota bacterium]
PNTTLIIMIPKTQFHHSPTYEEHLIKPAGLVPLKNDVLYRDTRKLELKWQKIEKKILQEISKITGLPWRESHIYIYITSNESWFSEPLTLSITRDTNTLLQILVHELIHRIISENENWMAIRNRWYKLMGKYEEEKLNARIHIPIHAIHRQIFLVFFGQKALQSEIERMKDDPDYARAWELVERDGYKNIIRALNPKFKK